MNRIILWGFLSILAISVGCVYIYTTQQHLMLVTVARPARDRADKYRLLSPDKPKLAPTDRKSSSSHGHSDALDTTKNGTVHPPHVIFIFADDLGFFDVGYHGSEIKTPVIDLMAKQGVRLENYYSQATCTPSRAVLMTGKYMNHNAMGHVIKEDEDVCLPLHHELLPQRLQKFGYMTHIVGKWHLGRSRWECLPNRRGFHSFLGVHNGGGTYFTHNNPFYVDEKAVPGNYKGIYSSHIYMNRSVEVIRNHALTKKGSPLFLYLAAQLPHTPNQVPEMYLKDYTNVTNEQRRMHSGMVAALDVMVGKVVGALKEYGLWNNSVLIFSSDNGGAAKDGGFNWPLRGRKAGYFEGGIKVVGFVTSPFLSEAVRGTTFKGLMGLTDWLPTIVEGIAGGNTMGIAHDGYNMWPSIRFGNESPRSDYLFSLGLECNATSRDLLHEFRFYMIDNVDRRTCYRWGNWKFIFNRNGTKSMHLYDIANDPYERKDLVDMFPDIIRSLRKKLQDKFCASSMPLIARHEASNIEKHRKNSVIEPWM